MLTLARMELEAFPPSRPRHNHIEPSIRPETQEEEGLKPLYRQIGDVLKKRCTGYSAYLLTGSPDLAKCIGLRASRRIVLFNGPIECRLLKFDLY